MDNFGQLILFENNFLRDDIYKKHKYIISESNKKLALRLSSLSLWSDDKFLILNGEKHSGKTHSSYFFTESNNGIVINHITCEDIYDQDKICNADCVAIDNIEYFEDIILFHVINYLKTKKVSVLLTCTNSIDIFKLKDLKSRLNSMSQISIEKPDNFLTQAIFSKILSDYDIKLNEKVLEYILPRLEHSFSAINSLIDKLRDIIFLKKEKMSLTKIKEILN
jgi:chromosomal replication initiation ATPase DnaA